MPVLDLLCRDPRITKLTLIEPDIYKPHNVDRHVFSPKDIGENKGELAMRWLKERRPDLEIRLLDCDLLDPAKQRDIERITSESDLGVCAADNEIAKYHWDSLMRKHGKPWTLGEVLSGGIGGFIHWFVAGGPCYGCVASHLHRSMPVEKPVVPDYSNPRSAVTETTIPASKASIQTIASLHALITLELLANPTSYDPGFTSLLFTMQRVPEVFDEAYRPYRFRITRAADCLICQPRPAPSSGEELDAALDQALARLGDE
jgi:molybdopterin/thiamine biosynthesis adenylyltransferase